MTEQEPDTATKIAEGSVLEYLHQIRDDDDDPVLKDVAKFLEERRPKLSRQEWYTLLQTLRDCSNRQRDLTQIMNEIGTGAAASPHTERGIVDGIILQQYNILLL